jgi:hypothetical protein
MGLYDLAFVEPGPLPPHERTWRHPSELGPTRADVDTGPHHHLAALTFGALAVMAVIGMVVAMTPRTSSAPVALNATTVPATVSTELIAQPRTATAATAGFSGSRIPIGALLTSFASMPHAIASAPPLTLDGTAIAARLPRADDLVLVRTDEVTYQLPWGQVGYLQAPDGSVVFDADGALVARILDGRVVTIVGD